LFNINWKTTVTIDKFEKIAKLLEKLAGKSVLIGVPEAETDRKVGEAASNAELAYIHEHGAPVHNLPKRKFLEPAIEDNIEQINKQQKVVLECTLENKDTQASLNALGLLGQSTVKNWFTNSKNGWEPIKPATIARKGSDKPLIDTAQLLNSITYIIRDN